MTDADIEQFYQATITGNGGPPPPGEVQDLVTRYFLWDGRSFAGRVFTQADHTLAFDTLKEQMETLPWKTYGGPKGQTADDGKDWVWLAAEMTCVGLCLQLYTSIPYGRRPVLVARKGEIAAMFEKLNWDKFEERLDIEMGTLLREEPAQPDALPEEYGFNEIDMSQLKNQAPKEEPEYKPGEKVMVRGLWNDSWLNGTECTLVKYHKEQERWDMTAEDGSLQSLRRINFETEWDRQKQLEYDEMEELKAIKLAKKEAQEAQDLEAAERLIKARQAAGLPYGADVRAAAGLPAASLIDPDKEPVVLAPSTEERLTPAQPAAAARPVAPAQPAPAAEPAPAAAPPAPAPSAEAPSSTAGALSGAQLAAIEEVCAAAALSGPLFDSAAGSWEDVKQRLEQLTTRELKEINASRSLDTPISKQKKLEILMEYLKGEIVSRTPA